MKVLHIIHLEKMINIYHLMRKNFYYYDNGHIVGSDLKQPRLGHIAIIMDENTRWTTFAQAIFRFRKLNRGTFMTVFLLKNKINEIKNVNQLLKFENTCLNDKNSISDIRDLLYQNETQFNKQQEDGIKLQLLKAVVRKKSKDYSEGELKPFYLLDKSINKKFITDRLIKNILNISEYTNHKLYDHIFNKLDEKKLKNLVLASNSKEQEAAKEAEAEEEAEAEADAIKLTEENLHRNQNLLKTKKIYYILHKNCKRCINDCTIKLFHTDNSNTKCKITKYEDDKIIESKPIYLSKNLRLNLQSKQVNYINNDNIYFVEFNDFILIELKIICQLYYLENSTVYDNNGEMINSIEKKILHFNVNILELLNLNNYIYRIDTDLNYKDLLTTEAAYIIYTLNKFYVHSYTNYSPSVYPYKFKMILHTKHKKN